MNSSVKVHIRSFSHGSMQEQDSGLLGWMVVEVDGWLILDGITLRLTRNGILRVSFPARTDKQGKRRAYIASKDDAVRIEFERRILGALAFEGDSS